MKLMGQEPVACEHRDYRDYLAILQRQYESMAQMLDPALVSTARIQGRALIHSETLCGAVRRFFPDPAPFAPYTPERRPKGPTYIPAKVKPAVAPRLLPSPTSGKTRKRKERSCTYKLRHPNLLSAMCHARGLDDGYIVIYECEFCDGLHLGHDKKQKHAQADHGTLL